jgi:hypothetical protein
MRTTWPEDELRKIAETDDLHISPFREDGKTYGTPTWIWSVVVDGALYVRSYNGKSGQWYQAALKQKSGRITAAGMTKEVSFESVSGSLSDRIDDANRLKYASSPVSETDDQCACARCDSQGHADLTSKRSLGFPRKGSVTRMGRGSTPPRCGDRDGGSGRSLEPGPDGVGCAHQNKFLYTFCTETLLLMLLTTSAMLWNQ